MRQAVIAGLMALTLAGCGGGGRPLHDMRTSSGGPDEFSVLPSRPLEMPTDLARLPAPTPGGTNKSDPTPTADAIAVLGGSASASTAGGVPVADGALVAQASRYGTDPAIRATLAEEDARFRARRSRLGLLNLFNRDRYFRAYAAQALDAYAEFLRFRNLGTQVPSAPPGN